MTVLFRARKQFKAAGKVVSPGEVIDLDALGLTPTRQMQLLHLNYGVVVSNADDQRQRKSQTKLQPREESEH